MELRIASLDLLRGLAALAVVVWHWNWLHFDPATGLVDFPPILDLPFHYIFYPIYKVGYLAVDLFFAISGFVFFHMYAERLANGQVTAREFSWNRFTRLYPLHLVTLLIVAVLQPIYHASHAAYFVYPDNSVTKFFLQLFMVSNWLPNSPYSFNGPIWSVSIEILLYALFFVVARRGLAKSWYAVALVLIGSFLIAHANMIGRGIMTFYIGALCYFTFKDRREFKALAVAIVGAGIIQVVHRGLISRDAVVIILGVPAFVLAFSLNEKRLKWVTSNMSWLGDISYSSYLLHFPVMLALVTAGLKLNPSSHVQMVVYLAGIVLLSLICFHYFERPVQKRLRGFIGRTKPKEAMSDLSATPSGHALK
jgi:peptidoglycan/LPS O-acetylase OafA/YrhL